MKTKPIEVSHKGLIVRIYVNRCIKGEKVYETFLVADYSTGKRKLHGFANEADARAKALDICKANSKAVEMSDHEMARLYLEKREIQNAYEEAEQAGLDIDEAVRLVRQAGEIIPIKELLEACRYWREKRPDKPIKAKTVKESAIDYLSRQQRISERRKRGLKCYYDQLCEKFGNRNLHELSTMDLKDFVDSKTWSPKTYNEVLGAYSLLFKEAQLRNWVPANCNPVSGIKRLKLLPNSIGIFEPDQVRTILSRIKEDLIPFTAIWLFAGARKEEVARLKWPQVRAALKTGVLEITGDVGQKTGARCVPLQPNLVSWLNWWLRRNPDASGHVLPLHRQQNRKLDDVTRRIATQAKIEWVSNAPRHSYITYRAKLAASITDVADECGNSPAKIERHYRRKGVTAESAKEFFSIMPPAEVENLLPMPDKLALAV